MIDREYRIRRNNARNAQREVINALEKFAKRSKHITILGSRAFYGFCRIDLATTKDTKVAQEMMNYLKNLCAFCESENNYTWFHNYDQWAENTSEDDWEVQFEICVKHH